MHYAEFATATNFSFLRGASQPRDLVLQALLLGHRGIGIADRNTVAGVVRAYSALEELRREGVIPPEKLRDGGGPGEFVWQEAPQPGGDDGDPAQLRRRAQNFKLAVGTRLVFTDETPDILAYPENRAGWGRLTRLLTIGNARAKKGDCILNFDDLLEDTHDLLLVVMPDRRLETLECVLRRLNEAAQGSVWLAAHMLRRGDDRRHLAKLKTISSATRVPL